MRFHLRFARSLRLWFMVPLLATVLITTLSGLTSEVLPAEAADPFRVVSGSYVGTGAARAIGIGFQPDLVMVKRSTGSVGYLRSGTMLASKPLGSGAAAIANVITALGSTGFDVGTHAGANAKGSTYYWTAFKAASAVMVTGTFTGNGGAQTIATGLQPALVMIVNTKSSRNVTLRFAGQTGDASVFGASAKSGTKHITALSATGFSVGTANPVDESGQSLHYVAWAAVPAQVTVGSYTSTGVAGAAIGSLPFAPQTVLLHGRANSANRALVYKSDAMPATGAFEVTATALKTSLVTALGSDGFTVGNAANTNASGEAYFFAAFRDGAQPPVVIGVESLTADGAYGAGSEIDIAMTFDRVVTVSGAPVLALATGAAPALATYVSGSGSATLTFRYVVGAEDNSPRLAYTGTGSLSGGTIVGAAGLTRLPRCPIRARRAPSPQTRHS